MKRFLSKLISMIIALCLSAPFVYASDNKYTAGGKIETYSALAAREQAVSCFVKAVGLDKLHTDRKILDNFSDKSKISYPYIEDMATAVFSGLICGYDDGTIKPQDPIKRIEALVILNRALSHTDLSNIYDTKFTDIPDWASTQVNRLASAGIIQGYGDGRLGANDYLTLEQVNIICSRIGHFTGPTGDFYTYANSGWLGSAELSNGEQFTSDITRLTAETNRRIEEIVFSLYKKHYGSGEKFKTDSDEFKIISVYSAAANQGYRDKLSYEPIKQYLSDIDSIKNTDELLTVMANLEKSGFSTLLPLSLDRNIYNASVYTLSVTPIYVGISNEMRGREDSYKYEESYIDYLKTLFSLVGEKDADTSAKYAAEVCAAFAKASDTRSYDIHKIASVYKIKDFVKLMPKVNIEKYLKESGFEKAKTIMLYNADFPETAQVYLSDKNLELSKAYLKASVLDSSAAYLSSDFFDAQVKFRNKIYGRNDNPIPSDYAMDAVQKLMGWELGKLYVEMYLPEYVKNEVKDMTDSIIDEYERLIDSSLRMSPQTRANAIKKLKSLTINIAFPDDFDDYTGSFTLQPIEDGGNLMGYITESAKSLHASCEVAISNGGEAPPMGFTLYPQTVNAIYDPASNSITVPAGILQPPYFDFSASYEENLGGIGMVIAHEISHAFDSTGSQFDEKGSLNSWWTPADRLAFENLCKKTVEEFNAITVGKDKVSGSLTLDENLADIAGMSCILSMLGNDNPNLESFFLSYAKSQRSKMSDEYTAISLKSDVHSPPKVRINRVLSNFDVFLDYYDIKEGDGMFIPSVKRINFWK